MLSNSYQTVKDTLDGWHTALAEYVENIKTTLEVDCPDNPLHIGGIARSCVASPLVSFVGGGVVAVITEQGVIAAGAVAAGVALTAVLVHTCAILLLQKMSDDYTQTVHSYSHAALCSLALASSALLWQVPFSWPAGVALLLPFFSAKIQGKHEVHLRHVPLFAWFT